MKMQQSDREMLAGLVERVTYRNADNGFWVIRVVRSPLQARRHLGVVFQEPSVDDRLTAADGHPDSLAESAPEVGFPIAASQSKGVKLGRNPKLTHHQKREAIARRDAGETLMEIARTYNVSHSTISRLS
jgi:hypothetical protein